MQKIRLVLVQAPDVVDVVSHDRHALDAETKCPSREHRRIVIHVRQHARMHHPGAAQLNPARSAAHAARTAGSVTERTRRVDFCARFGERKKRRTKAYLLPSSE